MIKKYLVNGEIVRIKERSGRYGRLTVVGLYGRHPKSNKWMFSCICDCGKEINVIGHSLASGNTQSCGCIFKEHVNHLHCLNKGHRYGVVHGLSRTRIYQVWKNMRDRCSNKKNPAYNHYGGRGIKVCKDWDKSFQKFYSDMSIGYQENLTIDRVDNDKGYYKENCRWATMKEQANNRRDRKEFERLKLPNSKIFNLYDKGVNKNIIAKKYDCDWSTIDDRIKKRIAKLT